MPTGYDFCGWASKNDLLCSDGRTIRRGAFPVMRQEGADCLLALAYYYRQCSLSRYSRK